MKWTSGVCGGRYKKKSLISNRFFEVSLLKCDAGENIGKHIDPAHLGRQYKVQVNIRRAHIGGNFICDKYILNTRLLKIYRADLSSHGVSLVVVGTRIDLIIGFNL